jgi:hypothetical protein
MEGWFSKLNQKHVVSRGFSSVKGFFHVLDQENWFLEGLRVSWGATVMFEKKGRFLMCKQDSMIIAVSCIHRSRLGIPGENYRLVHCQDTGDPSKISSILQRHRSLDLF